MTRVNTHSSANEDPKNSVLVIDGEAEVDDMLLAACFANVCASSDCVTT